MKLKRFLLLFHPPGIILEYLRKSGEIETKSIDLLNLTPEKIHNLPQADHAVLSTTSKKCY